MIELINIGKKYQTDDLITQALNSINLRITRGDFLALMGTSGSGKSSLLNILGLIDRPDEGKYFFLEEDVTKISVFEQADLRKKHVGFIFQNFNLIEELNVFDNVALPLIYQNTPKKERRDRVEAVLNQLGMDHRAKHYPAQLSGGQQQRVAIARAIITKPDLILADEPTGNLDSSNGKEVLEILQKLNEAGSTIVMVTHSPIDASYSKKSLQMHDGKLMNQA